MKNHNCSLLVYCVSRGVIQKAKPSFRSEHTSDLLLKNICHGSGVKATIDFLVNLRSLSDSLFKFNEFETNWINVRIRKPTKWLINGNSKWKQI